MFIRDPNYCTEPVGLLKEGTIKGYNEETGEIQVELNYGPATSNNPVINVPAPHSSFYNNGIFVGTRPDPGTTIVVAQGSGNQWYCVSFLAKNPDLFPTLTSGELLIQSNNKTTITLNNDYDIYIGSTTDNIYLDTYNGLYTTSFNQESHFTQAYKRINGLVKRIKLTSDNYTHKMVGMDPTIPINAISSSKKNPSFVEDREIIYEFEYNANINDDLYESSLYTDKDPEFKDFNFYNRRDDLADTFSLTLAYPNYLMETVKGTSVDIFGNILDINRIPIPIGKNKATLNVNNDIDKVQAFKNIKELERRSIAYHFERNARKDLLNTKIENKDILALLDINSNANYARNRSRFFIDIDKEGQFKINVPASSEKGNIPLLTRYENYSTFGADNPNGLEYREDNLDIFLDSFAAPAVNRNSTVVKPITSENRGSIIVKNDNVIYTPVDRITKTNIKHGTAYHDILNTCYVHSDINYLNSQYREDKTIDVEEIIELNNDENGSDLNNIVSREINIAGDNANAGGRSGVINLDGSLEFNIGANTIDRQSLWLDTAGGIIGNIGRDRKNKSLAMNLDGDVFLQIGGVGVATDNRFTNNAFRAAVLDLRVLTDNGGRSTMIRIDRNGIQILSQNYLKIHATKGMKISSDSKIDIDCESLTLQGRVVNKKVGGSI